MEMNNCECAGRVAQLGLCDMERLVLGMSSQLMKVSLWVNRIGYAVYRLLV